MFSCERSARGVRRNVSPRPELEVEMEISVMMIKFVSAAAILAAAAGAQGAFTLSTHGFGDTGGTPYTTSNGTGMYQNSIVGATLNPGANGLFGVLAGTEWTTYITEDALGPSRAAPNDNGSDAF